MSDEAVQRAWAYLSRVAEPPCPELAALVADVGPVEAAASIRSGTVSDHLAPLVEARRGEDSAAEDLDLLAARGGRLVTPEDDEWPYLAFTAFGGAEVRKKPRGAPPMVLWALGPARLDEIAERSAALVGTRAATAYGEHVAAEFAVGLVERDVAVVSGGAFGIDGAAHRATLAADGTTVAVLAGGIDIPYPAGHSALLHRISATGLLVTEYPPGVRPARHRFLTRNRLVAVLSRATVVVEAGLRSGAANTASWADAMGRAVCAVPGPVTSAASAGCHQLLRRDGLLVTRADEIVEIVGRSGELAEEPEHPASRLDGLPEAARLVYEALPARGLRSVEQISVGSGLPVERVLGPLALLEIAGLVEKIDGRWRLVRC
jgi:DNA processing protein